MNCKPGDLAVVVRLTNEDLRPYLGRIVTCVRLGDMDCWETAPMLEPYRCVYDGALIPIRDPGDDAKDETLSWLPVPSREGVEA